MATNQQYTLSNDIWHVFCEWNLTAAGAVVPNADGTTTSEPEISVVRSTTGTYVATIPGNFQKVVKGDAYYRTAGGTTGVACLGVIGLGTGVAQAGGGATTTVLVTTAANNAAAATPADLGSGTVGFNVKFQKHKI